MIFKSLKWVPPSEESGARKVSAPTQGQRVMCPHISTCLFWNRTGFIPSKKYVSQPEIAEYAEILTDHIGVRENISFDRKVTETKIPWGTNRIKWRVRTVNTKTGQAEKTVSCTHIVSANGPLSSPRMPELGGMELFKGESFHTAQWDGTAKFKRQKSSYHRNWSLRCSSNHINRR